MAAEREIRRRIRDVERALLAGSSEVAFIQLAAIEQYVTATNNGPLEEDAVRLGLALLTTLVNRRRYSGDAKP